MGEIMEYGTQLLVTMHDLGRVPNGLLVFLSRDPDMRDVGHVHWESTQEPKADELGNGLDILAISLSSVIALPSAIEVIRRWCSSPTAPTEGVVIRLGSQTISVAGTEDPTTIRHLAEVLKAAYPEQ
ncbi:hypothetical protein [Streptomyces sp. NEAU-YJ-81]|uniref:effector-associated constant component EACC1 n=1 Tax=Streptomyces sp. NEAU-YJ-81 TaxID=2820288 RepID=UPI001ABC9396|nr:hypothetical protein [Streptomyces sp. NEAU-YJ-81]MBO3682257.1 hypothetical protein [Streptomyces sp. NEAU-YJ-81]